MNFEWDEAKSEVCFTQRFTQRGFDFAYAARAFFDPTESFMPTPGTARVKSATN